MRARHVFWIAVAGFAVFVVAGILLGNLGDIGLNGRTL